MLTASRESGAYVDVNSVSWVLGGDFSDSGFRDGNVRVACRLPIHVEPRLTHHRSSSVRVLRSLLSSI